MTSTDGEEQIVAQGSTSSEERNMNSVAAEDKSSSVTVAELGVSVPSKKPRMRVGPPPKGSFAQRHGSEHKTQISDVVPNEMPDSSGHDNSAVDRPPAEESVVQQQDTSTISTHVDGKNVRLHWDLNLPVEAWGQPCDFEGEASGSKEVVASDGSKADEAAAGKGKEC